MRRLALIACVLAVPAAGLEACTRTDVRIKRRTLERETLRSFKRSFAAELQMTTGNYADHHIGSSRAYCRALSPMPAGDEAWRWHCRVVYSGKGGESGTAVYGVRVDERGCFSERSASFPAFVPDPALRRRSRNPLNVLRGCPDRFEVVRYGEADRK